MLWILDWILFLIGLPLFLSILFYILNSVKTITSRLNLEPYGPGSWAVITGATDGIGKAFAEELAKSNFNIILISRSPDKLQAVSAALEQEYRIKTMTIVRDFTSGASDPISFFTSLHSELKDKDISILVNNIGYGHTSPFIDLPAHRIYQMNSLNLWPIVFLTKLLLPDLLKRKHKSLIVNLSSVLALQPLPSSAIYCGGKAFDDFFSLILQLELNSAEKQQKIDTLTIRPGFVDTALVKNLKSRPLLITPTECARGSLSVAGSIRFTHGHWKHVMLGFASRLILPISSLFGKLPAKNKIS